MTSKRITSGLLALLMTASMLPADMSVTAAGDKTTLTPTNSSGGLTITLKIKAEITPTVTIADWQYKGTPSTPEVTGNEGNGAVTYKYKVKGADDSTYTEAVPTAQGEYTVKADIAETDDYNAGSATADFNIKPYTTGLTITLKIKETIEPTVTLADWTYGSTASTPTVEGNTGGGAVTYKYKAKDADDSTYTDTVPTIPGEYTVKAEIAETAEYKSGEATADFKINKAAITPSVTIDNWTYGDTASTPTVEGNSGNGTVTYLYKTKGAEDSTYNTTVPTNAGDYTVKAIIPDTVNYNGGTATADFTIAKKTLTITAEAKSKTYGTTDPELTYSAEGLVGEDKVTGKLTREAGENVGTFAIQQGTLTAGDNYNITFEGANLTINKAALTITAEAKSKTYGTADPKFTYSTEGLVGKDKVTGKLTRAAGENVGTYAIQQGTLTAGDNYNITFNGADLTINKAALTITAEAKSKTYGTADPEFTYSTEGLVGEDTVTGKLDRAAGEDVGTYAIQQGTLTASDNYDVTFKGADFTITKADAAVTAPTANKLTYNRKAQALVKAGSTKDGKLLYALGKDSKTAPTKFTETIPTATNAGTYYVWYKVDGDKNHNDSQPAAVEVKLSALSIKKAKTVKVNNKTYTGKALKPGSKVVLNGKRLKKGVDYTITFKNNTKVGIATAVIKGIGNYSDSVTTKFNVRPKKGVIKSISSPKTRKLKLTWKKIPQADGYNIKVSTNKNFKGKLTRNVYAKKNSFVKKTFAGIPSGKTYYVKVRAYKKVKGGKIFGQYSEVKTVKVK